MSASRTLLRKGKAEDLRRMKRGKRIKPGERRRRVTDISERVIEGAGPMRGFTYAELRLEADYHATKGYRVRRADR